MRAQRGQRKTEKFKGSKDLKIQRFKDSTQRHEGTKKHRGVIIFERIEGAEETGFLRFLRFLRGQRF